jgi:flavorubredoxin
MSPVRAQALPPRLLCPGLHWLFTCDVSQQDGAVTHGYTSVFLLDGGDKTLLVDTGRPKDWKAIDAQLEGALAGRALDLIFPTHAEYVHTGNLPRLLDKHPHAVAVGDLTGFELYFPGYAARFRQMGPGDAIDLGGARLQLVAPILYDLPQTLWAYDPERRVLFASDGLAHEHHRPDECGLTSEELSALPDPENFALYNDRAFYWARYTETGVYFRALREFLGAHPVSLIAPAHGTVITRAEPMLERAEAGLAAPPRT